MPVCRSVHRFITFYFFGLPHNNRHSLKGPVRPLPYVHVVVDVAPHSPSPGSEALPAGSGALPAGSEALPAGSKALLAGSKALQTGHEALPPPSELHPALSETLPATPEAMLPLWPLFSLVTIIVPYGTAAQSISN